MSHPPAREPRWWSNFVELYYPRVYFGFLDRWAEDKEWFRKFLAALPSKCPFERQYWLGDKYLIYYVPALCKFNPVFAQLMALKIRVMMDEANALSGMEKAKITKDKKDFFNGLVD